MCGAWCRERCVVVAIQDSEVTAEIDFDNDNYQNEYSDIDDHRIITYKSGNIWRNGWPEPEPANGSITWANHESRRFENLDIIQRQTPHKMRVSIGDDMLFSGNVRNLASQRRGSPEYGVKGELFSDNRRLFGRQVEWANTENKNVFEAFQEIIGLGNLKQGSLVLGTQNVQTASYTGPMKGLLSEFSRGTGSYVGEDRHANIDAMHWGLGKKHIGFTLDMDDIHVDIEKSEGYRRDLKTHGTMGVTYGVTIPNSTLKTVNENLDPRETRIVRIVGEGNTLIVANWHDPEPYLGVTSRIISKGSKTLVLELRNVTDSVINYTLPFTGDPVYARSEDVLTIPGPFFGDIPNDELRLPKWFADGELGWGRYTYGYYRDGIPWAKFNLLIDQNSRIPLVIQPGVVFDTTGGEQLDMPGTIWLCYQAEWKILPKKSGDFNNVTVECIGLTDDGKSRWGEAIWNRSSWNG